MLVVPTIAITESMMMSVNILLNLVWRETLTFKCNYQNVIQQRWDGWWWFFFFN